jgi:NADH:ubiquinone oxidoreductase subunit 4 (subunit M)
MTARHLVESSRPISEGTQNPQMKTRRITAKIVVGLTVVFLISLVPYHVFWTYINYTKKEVQFELRKTPDILDHSNYQFQYTYLISTCFLLINSCLNPVALFCTSSPIRQHLKRYLTCFWKTNSPPTALELTRST